MNAQSQGFPFWTRIQLSPKALQAVRYIVLSILVVLSLLSAENPSPSLVIGLKPVNVGWRKILTQPKRVAGFNVLQLEFENESGRSITADIILPPPVGAPTPLLKWVGNMAFIVSTPAKNPDGRPGFRYYVKDYRATAPPNK